MNVNSLFARRWNDHVREQYRLLRFTFDWIVMLYIGIPALLLLGRLYYALWKETLPVWLQHLPDAAVPVFLLIVAFAFSGIRLYIEAADVLVLKQKQSWLHGIMLRGAAVSMLCNFSAIALCFAFIAPLLVRIYGWGATDILAVYGVTCGVNAVCSWMTQSIRVIWSGWKQLLLHAAGFILLGGAFILAGTGESAWYAPETALPALAVCSALAFGLAWHRFHLKGRFEAEVREEERQKTRLTGILLANSVDPPQKTKSRPWLFRRSGRLLRSERAEDRLAETMFKSFLRGRTLRLYGQFALLGCSAVFLPPFPVNLIVYAALLLLLVYWLNGHRQAFFAGDAMSVLPLREDTEFLSAPRTMRMLLYPAVVPLTCVIGATLAHAWWGAAVAVPAGLIIVRFVSPLWTMFPSNARSRRRTTSQ